MPYVKNILPFLSLATLVCVPVAEASAEAACQQLSKALSEELSILRSTTDAASASVAAPRLESVLKELAEMDRSPEAERILWEYIDNTPGAKLPLIELLQQLTVELSRLQQASFFNNENIRSLLAPQLVMPKRGES